YRRAAIDVAAGDGAPVRVRVDEHRPHEASGACQPMTRRVDRVALVAAPAVVRELVEPTGGAEVDLFPRVLADVADPEVVGRRIEREAPRVAQAEPNDLPGAPRRLRLRAAPLAEPRALVLGGLVRVAFGAPVAEPEVGVAALVELQLPAVVVVERLVDGEDDAAARTHPAAVGRAVAGDARVPVPI